MPMRKTWLIAGAVAAAAGSSPAAEVDVFGIHTPTLGKWAVYAKITGATAPSSLASISVDVLNNGASTVSSSAVNLPFGQSIYTDATKFPNDPNVGYGFWFLRQNGTVSGTGAQGIAASQWTTYDASDPIPYRDLILPGIGLTPGTATKNDTTGGNFKTSTAWSYPVLIASGTYTPAGTTGAGANVGLNLAFTNPSSSANILQWVPANNDYTVDPNPILSVIDARNHTLGASNSGTATVYARPGDANLDGQVNFTDLLQLARNYNNPTASWFQGDFDYNGVVNFNDLLALARAYGSPGPSSPEFSSAFEQSVASAFSQVPEPTTVGVLVTAICVNVLRRQRKL